jgi:hypothetical protein
MTTRSTLRSVLAQRRAHARDSIEWAYLTRAARKLAWIVRGVPTSQWGTE